MKDSEQHQITKSGQKMEDKLILEVQKHLEHVWLEVAAVGTRFDMWETMTKVWRSGNYRYVRVKCTACREEKDVHYDNIKAGKSRGCKSCSLKRAKGRTTPAWLRSRVSCMIQRCTNPNNPNYVNYGARGIEFRFSSIEDGAKWIAENLGTHKDLEIDRIDNNGHYEPGNLRWATERQQVYNRTNTTYREDFVFREEEWPYHERTVRRKLREGMTRDQMIEEAEDIVRNKKTKWRIIRSNLERMISSTQGHDVASPLKT